MFGRSRLLVGRPKKVNYEDIVNQIINLRFMFRSRRELGWFIRYVEKECNLSLDTRIIEEKLDRKGRLEHLIEVQDGTGIVRERVLMR